jgi:hypothetical protein
VKLQTGTVGLIEYEPTDGSLRISTLTRSAWREAIHNRGVRAVLAAMNQNLVRSDRQLHARRGLHVRRERRRYR